MESSDYALMQCVSAYPTPDSAAHLAGITALRTMSHAPIGYSDHTTSEETGGFAVAVGASLLEKHLTHNREADGPDHSMSLEPDQFERYVRFARRASAMLGQPQKVVHELELDVRRVSRQSLVTTRPLKAGHRLEREDLTLKRPGVGLEPAKLHEVIGRQLRRSLDADTPITDAHLEMRSSSESNDSEAIELLGCYDPAA
jgi:sialic acid synthase SpsE